MLPSSAASAYQAAAKITDSVSDIKNQAQGTKIDAGADSFQSLLTDAMGSVTEIGKASDVQSMAMANGTGDIVDVVTAVAETEVALQTMVTMRDKVISAYEEIMRMPI